MDELFIKSLKQDIELKKLRAVARKEVLRLRQRDRQLSTQHNSFELKDEGEGAEDTVDGTLLKENNNTIIEEDDYTPLFSDKDPAYLADKIEKIKRDNRRLCDRSEYLRSQLSFLSEKEEFFQEDLGEHKRAIQRLEQEQDQLEKTISVQSEENVRLTSQLSLKSPFLFSDELTPMTSDIYLLKLMVTSNTLRLLENLSGESLDDKFRMIRNPKHLSFESHIDLHQDCEQKELVTLFLKFQDDLIHHQDSKNESHEWLTDTTQNILSQIACIVKSITDFRIETTN